MKYRDFLTLTDDEITYMLKSIFGDVTVSNIKRDRKSRYIFANIVFEDSDEKILDAISFDEVGVYADTFMVDDKENLKIKQYMAAKGCSPLFYDNPYLENQEAE